MSTQRPVCIAPTRSRWEVMRVTMCPAASRAITTRPLGVGLLSFIVGAFLFAHTVVHWRPLLVVSGLGSPFLASGCVVSRQRSSHLLRQKRLVRFSEA